MDSHIEEQSSTIQVLPPNKEKIKRLWTIAAYLGIITCIEFLIAFLWPDGALKIALFVGLTIVKAFYIVAEFMHLGHEVKVMIWSILLPLIFVVWLILALLIQGDAIFLLKY
ncbi:MAG: cytochrome C oxidase subunit IV family protein [Bacteroidetes bacterium]|nr:cytochrome C oxidase subunit IV family protein [Bacteroidota bacterium]MDA1120353.1 cytochrome C oxidase subunit IV family protein [Bacteroidota bacterium]